VKNLLEIWGQANVYSKFILLLSIVYPVSMMYLAYRIEIMFPDIEKAPLAATK